MRCFRRRTRAMTGKNNRKSIFLINRASLFLELFALVESEFEIARESNVIVKDVKWSLKYIARP